MNISNIIADDTYRQYQETVTKVRIKIEKFTDYNCNNLQDLENRLNITKEEGRGLFERYGSLQTLSESPFILILYRHIDLMSYLYKESFDENLTEASNTIDKILGAIQDFILGK